MRAGLPLPSWPSPTHANPRPTQRTFAVGDEAVQLGGGGGGPRTAVTARDAIGDLPRTSLPDATDAEWDYTVLGGEGVDNYASPYPPAVDFGDRVGVLDGTPYRRAPMTAFQKAARGDDTGVRDHVTQIPPPSSLYLYVCPVVV